MASDSELKVGQKWRVSESCSCSEDAHFGDDGYILITNIGSDGDLSYDVFDNEDVEQGSCSGCVSAENLTQLLGMESYSIIGPGGIPLQVGQQWFVRPEQIDSRSCDMRKHLKDGGYLQITALRRDGGFNFDGYDKNGNLQHSDHHCYYVSDLLSLYGGASMLPLKTLTAEQEAVLPEPEKSMVEAQVLDDTLRLTSTGRTMFDAFMYEANRAKFAKHITEKVAETKVEIAKAQSLAKKA